MYIHVNINIHICIYSVCVRTYTSLPRELSLLENIRQCNIQILAYICILYIHYNTLQRTATHSRIDIRYRCDVYVKWVSCENMCTIYIHKYTLRHTATHCNTFSQRHFLYI